MILQIHRYLKRWNKSFQTTYQKGHLGIVDLLPSKVKRLLNPQRLYQTPGKRPKMNKQIHRRQIQTQRCKPTEVLMLPNPPRKKRRQFLRQLKILRQSPRMHRMSQNRRLRESKGQFKGQMLLHLPANLRLRQSRSIWSQPRLHLPPLRRRLKRRQGHNRKYLFCP